MDLGKILKPRSLAVIGVSLTNEKHPANVIYNKNHLRHQAKTFAVNPRGGYLRDRRVYQNVSEVPERLDLAVIVTRADYVPDVMTECIEAGVGGAIVISGGFAETGQRALQDRLASIARDAQFPFIGPNCLGIYSPPHADTFFIPSERMVRPGIGRVAMVSQSGGILVDFLLQCVTEGVDVSAAVSIGNKALIKETDLLRYFRDDPATNVIAFYIEGFGEGEGRRFALAAAECPKPVIVIKAGKSPGGTKAVSSHTASMAGDYRVFSSVMKQFGIVEAQNEFELVSFAEALTEYQKPIEGRVAIVTGSGGHGALTTDLCFAHDLVVPVFDEEFRRALQEKVSPSIREIGSFRNPIDLTGSCVDEDFVAVTRSLSGRDDIDCILILMLPYTPGISMDLGAQLGLVYQQEGKPIIAYVPHVDKYNILIEGFLQNNVPVAYSVEHAVHMADAMRRNKSC